MRTRLSFDRNGVRLSFDGNAEAMRLAIVSAGLTEDEFFSFWSHAKQHLWAHIQGIITSHITGTNQPLFKTCNPTFALYDASGKVVARWGHDGSVLAGNVRPLTPPLVATGRVSEDWDVSLVIAYADVVADRIKQILSDRAAAYLREE